MILSHENESELHVTVDVRRVVVRDAGFTVAEGEGETLGDGEGEGEPAGELEGEPDGSTGSSAMIVALPADFSALSSLPMTNASVFSVNSSLDVPADGGVTLIVARVPLPVTPPELVLAP